MRKSLLAGVALGALIAGSVSAQASIVRAFSGSGSSGVLNPDGSEPWAYGSGTPILDDQGNSTTDVGWGSPGVSQSLTASNEAVSVTDFEITFANPLDAAQVAQGNGAGCVGSAGGGTVFCTAGAQWSGVLESPDSVAFFAPPGGALDPGEDYFVNVMLLGGEGVSGSAFLGDWTAETAVPEPASLALLGAGLVGLGFFRRRRGRVRNSDNALARSSPTG